ncbi:MAG: response regulator [Dehalococcoidia bacterium]
MPQRILVVDDERTIRELVCEVLADEGYEVIGASNGAEALSALEQNAPFSLVVLDMWMPVMNGWQFAAEIAERGISVPIVVMTAAREARHRAEEIGAIGYIGKPFDVDQFIESVETAIRSSGPALENGASFSDVTRPISKLIFAPLRHLALGTFAPRSGGAY